MGSHGRVIGEREVERSEFAGMQVNGGEASEPLRRISADQASGSGKRIGGHAEDPLRLAEFGFHGCNRIDLPGVQCAAIQIPPAGPVRNEK